MPETSRADVVVVGAGPYGIAVTAHLRRAGVNAQVFGDAMSFWRRMPSGMLLRSNWSATNIAELHGELSLRSFQEDTGMQFGQPVPVERFIDYGDWVQKRVVPDLDPRWVKRVAPDANGFLVHLEDGDTIGARRVIVAGGIAPFAWCPPEFSHLPSELLSHSGDHSDMGVFSGQRIAIVGGGQSALECAALASEAGAAVEIFVRNRKIVWLREIAVIKRLGRLGPILYAPTDVGPLWYSRLVALPDLFRRLPRSVQNPIAYRSFRPAASHWLVGRLNDVPIHLGRTVTDARRANGHLRLRLSDGTTREVDHLLCGTGYRVDVRRYGFLDPNLVNQLRLADGYPVLRHGLESSISGLHFLGAPAAWSFGPIMRFVSGSWYSSRAVTRRITAARPSTADDVAVPEYA